MRSRLGYMSVLYTASLISEVRMPSIQLPYITGLLGLSEGIASPYHQLDPVEHVETVSSLRFHDAIF